MDAKRLTSDTGLRALFLVLPEDVRAAIGGALRVAPFATALGIAIALLWPKHYLSTGSFVAESQNLRNLPSALGALADQFGVSAGAGGAQSPAFFADLLDSRAILLPILSMSTTTSNDAAPKPLLDRLDVGGPEREDRDERGLRKLRSMLTVAPDAKTNVVTFGVDARDPTLACQIAEALLRSLDQFNVSVRRSRARNEREFLEARVSEAQADLRTGEGELERFLSSNRDFRSPSLAVQEARLRRKVDLAQTRFLELQRQLDQARVQEVRDTPVITVLDRPNLPKRHYRPRRSLVVLTVLLLGMMGAYGFSRLGSAFRAGPAQSPGLI
jgi:uncharacterized protein involved in exopolysaccharide biosynthesis